MTLADRVSIVLMLALGVFALLAPWLARRGALRHLQRALDAHPAAARWVEEVRTMPGYDQRDTADENDQVVEGLGREWVLPARWCWTHTPGRWSVKRAWPTKTTALELLPRGERELWRDAVKASQ